MNVLCLATGPLFGPFTSLTGPASPPPPSSAKEVLLSGPVLEGACEAFKWTRFFFLQKGHFFLGGGAFTQKSKKKPRTRPSRAPCARGVHAPTAGATAFLGGHQGHWARSAPGHPRWSLRPQGGGSGRGALLPAPSSTQTSPCPLWVTSEQGPAGRLL
jgi:hypothetical protein